MKLLKVLQWPAVFVVLGLLLDDKWPTVVITLSLAYYREVSGMMRRLTVVEMPGFKGYLGKDAKRLRPLGDASRSQSVHPREAAGSLFSDPPSFGFSGSDLAADRSDGVHAFAGQR